MSFSGGGDREGDGIWVYGTTFDPDTQLLAISPHHLPLHSADGCLSCTFIPTTFGLTDSTTAEVVVTSSQGTRRAFGVSGEVFVLFSGVGERCHMGREDGYLYRIEA